MLEPWNNSSILPPPVNMFLSAENIDISALRYMCSNIIKILSKQSPLHRESALCSRFLYKYDRKFRNDIGYRNFKKVHTALKKYLALNLLKDIEYIISALPAQDDDENYLPTRQMLQYVMLRIITFSMIMLRICICSKQAAVFYLNRIKRGESHWMSLLPYALLSRLWSMSMVLLQHSSGWYSNLYPYLDKLEMKGLNFLPENYSLPQDLEQWLDLKNVDSFGRFDWDQSKIIGIETALLDDGEGDLFENILNFVNQSNKNELDELEDREDIKLLLEDSVTQLNKIPVKMEDYSKALVRGTIAMDQGEVLSREKFKEDQGKALSRESFKILHKDKPSIYAKQSQVGSDEPKKVTKNIEKHCYETVTNCLSLKQFIDKEEQFRNESDQKALTCHLSFMQWHALKSALIKLSDDSTNRKIEKKFTKIWKEKCLDYM